MHMFGRKHTAENIGVLSEMRDARMVAQNRGVSMEKVFRG